jgi:hypothetical protein
MHELVGSDKREKEFSIMQESCVMIGGNTESLASWIAMYFVNI